MTYRLTKMKEKIRNQILNNKNIMNIKRSTYIALIYMLLNTSTVPTMHYSILYITIAS